MRIYISADIEGIAGVVMPQQCQAGNSEYERARLLMTEEVNAAIVGALTAGATDILVNDSHGPMTNLLPDRLHPAARLISGKPKPMNMFAGLTAEYDLVFCIGYHASASNAGVLAHTTNSFAFRSVRVGKTVVGEAALYGAYAGELGVPVALISGDDHCLAENRLVFPWAEGAIVKRALGARAADALSPQAARQVIQDSAVAAIRRKSEMRPLVLPPARYVELDMATPALADLVATIPVAKRQDPMRVRLPVASAADAVGWVNVASAMSAQLR